MKPVLKAKPTAEEQPKSVVTPTSDSSDQLVSKIQPPKIKPFNINLKDTDGMYNMNLNHCLMI